MVRVMYSSQLLTTPVLFSMGLYGQGQLSHDLSYHKACGVPLKASRPHCHKCFCKVSSYIPCPVPMAAGQEILNVAI